MPQPDESADVVLLLGPLYHLQEETERVLALSEAWRALRPGGLVFGAAITRFASLFDGLAREMLFNLEFRAIIRQDLKDGRHQNVTAQRGWFTSAYFHHPDELFAEARMAGLTVHDVFGVEGMTGWHDRLGARLDDPVARELILAAARATESEPSLRGLSPHMLLVATKPEV